MDSSKKCNRDKDVECNEHVMYKDIELSKGKTCKPLECKNFIAEALKVYDDERKSNNSTEELRKELESVNNVKDLDQKRVFNEEAKPEITIEDLLKKKERLVKLLESKNADGDAKYYEKIEDRIRRKNSQSKASTKASYDNQRLKSNTHRIGSSIHRTNASSPVPSKNMVNERIKKLLTAANTPLYNGMKLGDFAKRLKEKGNKSRLTTEERNAMLHCNSYSRINAIRGQHIKVIGNGLQC